MAILKMYAPFFDGNNWLHVLTSGKDWMIILTLIIMECLLSVDNAARTESIEKTISIDSIEITVRQKSERTCFFFFLFL